MGELTFHAEKTASCQLQQESKAHVYRVLQNLCNTQAQSVAVFG